MSCRLFLAPYDLTPSYKLVHNKFSVKYYLNLVLVDEEDRRYFKQQEIHLYRLQVCAFTVIYMPLAACRRPKVRDTNAANTLSSD